MKLFSHRKGLKPLRTTLQKDAIDDSLRNRLWDVVTLSYWDEAREYYMSDISKDIFDLVKKLWHLYFKQPIDTIPNNWPDTYGSLRKYFFTCQWNDVYDFIEFVANHHRYEYTNSQFISRCNSILEQELSAYRFVGGQIAEITSEEEIRAIEEALLVPESVAPVRSHLKSALDKLADKKNPDYRNSIKESISAVESLCKLLTKNPKASLGEALKQLETKVQFHPALKGAFSSLYGYTSDADGIRHALLEQPNLTFEDAKFMLVSCSAFVNYVIGKASKAGLNI